MPKKKHEESIKSNNPNVVGLRAEVLEQPITETLELNFMPYAMSVIISRAIPEIDGFKRRENSCTRCIKWDYRQAPARNRQISSDRR